VCVCECGFFRLGCLCDCLSVLILLMNVSVLCVLCVCGRGVCVVERVYKCFCN